MPRVCKNWTSSTLPMSRTKESGNKGNGEEDSLPLDAQLDRTFVFSRNAATGTGAY